MIKRTVNREVNRKKHGMLTMTEVNYRDGESLFRSVSFKTPSGASQCLETFIVKQQQFTEMSHQ